MKYIRTKDGKIYDSLALRVDEIVYKDEQGKWCREYRIVDPLKKALKIADTIPELCDEFDAINVGLFSDRKKTYKSVKEAEKDRTFLYDKLRGVIYTDKGRIYVAEKFGSREWELL